MIQFHRVTDPISAGLATPRGRTILGVSLIPFAALILSLAAVGFASPASSTKVAQPRAPASASAASTPESYLSDSVAQPAAVTAEQAESDPMIPQVPADHPELLLQYD